jgi:putative SOS response-associated peptidase YedK
MVGHSMAPMSAAMRTESINASIAALKKVDMTYRKASTYSGHLIGRSCVKIGNRMINARAETLTELPSFKLLVDRHRCIILADGFYEWRKEGKRKVQCEPGFLLSSLITTTDRECSKHITEVYIANIANRLTAILN